MARSTASPCRRCPALIWDPQRPFTSFVKAYAPLGRMAMTNGRIGSLGLIENNAGVSSRVVYEQFRIDRWADGKIAAVTAGPLSMESPSPGRPGDDEGRQLRGA